MNSEQADEQRPSDSCGIRVSGDDRIQTRGFLTIMMFSAANGASAEDGFNKICGGLTWPKAE
jgi:hypothetical protein